MHDLTKIDEANTMCTKFRLEFQDKFGITPYIYFSEKALKVPSLDLDVLEQVVNSFIFAKFGDMFPDAVRQNTRVRGLVMYRQILFYIAKNMGYQLHLISRFYAKTNGKPWNHATVLHSCNLVKNCIETKDKEFTKIYKEINEGFQERFRDAELVRSANLQKTIT
jgi:hypothetical protein